MTVRAATRTRRANVKTEDPDYRKLRDAKLLHTPHHATCPQADQFRRKKEESAQK